MILGDPSMWSDLFPEDMVPEILDLVWDTWAEFPPPAPDELEVPLTRRFKTALKHAKDFRRLPLRIEREPAEDDPTTAEELGRIDLKLSPAGSAREEVYFAFECKRLYAIEHGTRRARAAEYVKEGMFRFCTGQYAVSMRHGGMIGYVLNGRCYDAIGAVEKNFTTHVGTLCMSMPARFHPSALRPENDLIRETTHNLKPSRPFRLHHIFLAGSPDTSGAEDDS
jgi:hypothetical protein